MILKYLDSLNNSKFFSGIVMIMLNIGSKYITVKLSETQEQMLRNSIARQLLIFSITWMGTRDIIKSLALTAVFHILTEYLFNEDSRFCVIPQHMRQLSKQLDLDNNNKISQKEIQHAVEILEKAKKQERKREFLRLMNRF